MRGDRAGTITAANHYQRTPRACYARGVHNLEVTRRLSRQINPAQTGRARGAPRPCPHCGRGLPTERAQIS